MDLVVNPVGEYDCGPRVTNDKFGSKNSEIGLLAVAAGMEATFEFRFVKAGTSEPVDAQSLMLSFLDIDQGLALNITVFVIVKGFVFQVRCSFD